MSSDLLNNNNNNNKLIKLSSLTWHQLRIIL